MRHLGILFSSNTLIKKLFSFSQLGIGGGKLLIAIAMFFVGSFPSVALSQQRKSVSLSEVDGAIIIESDAQSSDSVNVLFSAFGNVRVRYPLRGVLATSRQLQYFKNEGIVVLIGDVDLILKGRDSIKGERLVYMIKDDQLIADSKPGSQVLFKLIVQPDLDNLELTSR